MLKENQQQNRLNLIDFSKYLIAFIDGEDLLDALTSPEADQKIIGALINDDIEIITFITGSLESIIVSFSWFLAYGVTRDEIQDLGVTLDANAVLIGPYEFASETITFENLRVTNRQIN